MSEQLLPGYIICRGSALDRALLLKFMQQTYQDLFPKEDFSHLEQTVRQYFSSDTPLWWVEQESGGSRGSRGREELLNNDSSSPPASPAPPTSTSPIACLWVGNAIDQVQGNRHAHIFILYVVPEHRRRGIGTALMRYVENWAIQRGDRQIGLQVFQSNKPALNLYNQLGYQTQSLWMVKFLSAEK
ncbi:MAG: GNAT family N-acetyltransferase [Nostoc sp.]|uniref:GNAT family N-acetyltransferase n=1 Tax=Nostoc sp. TaxID=1180 RepID=UPI002FF1CF44